MARSVNTGWRVVTPGACPECGFEDDYGCDGRGTVRCSCSPDFDESYDTTEARPPKAEHHWIVGGGSLGCLYDFGPVACETLDEALDTLDGVYELTTDERNELRWHKHLSFEAGRGADYCEIAVADGPCPEPEEDREQACTCDQCPDGAIACGSVE